MKKLLKKAMVFTLTAAMLVGTPLTASAADLVDVYSIQKPGMPVDAEEEINTSGTGTVTNTETGSRILTDNESGIRGIALDKEIVEAEAGINETLTATIILENNEINFDSVSGNATDDEKKEEALRRLSEKITWKLGRLNANGEFVQDTSLSETLGIKIDAGENNNVDRRTLTLIPKQGTVAGKEIYVQASINGSYYITKEGEVKAYDTDLGDVQALAKVTVKQYTRSLKWKWQVEGSGVSQPVPYVNHAIDLSKYLVRDPETANDTITWAVSSAEKGVATVTATGVVTIKKADKAFTVYAEGEKCAGIKWEVAKTQKGEPATGVEIWEVDEQGAMTQKLGTKPIDVGAGGTNSNENIDQTISVKAKLIATKKVVLDASGNPATTQEAADAGKGNKTTYRVGSKKLAEGDQFIEATNDKTNLVTPEGANSVVQTLAITDYVTWSSNKTGIANVVVNAKDDRCATITVSKDAQIGSATITAKTPKKSAKMTVKVSATLLGLRITNTEKELYSGQTLQMTYERTPAGNKDSIKWSVSSDEAGSTKSKSATINGKGILTIKPTKDPNEDKVYVWLKSPKKGSRAEKTAEKYEITLKQSSIDGITVTETNPGVGTVAEVKTDANGKVKQTQRAGTTQLDMPINARYTVEIVLGSNGDAGLTKEIAVNTLTYKNSKPKVVEITRSANGKLTITPKATGTAKITVSGVRATKNAQEKVTGKAISTSFNVKVSQPVTSVTLNKPTIVLVEKKKADGTYQDVKFSGLKATFGPKKANKSAEKKIEKWEIKKGSANYECIPKSATNSAPNTSTTLSYTLKQPKAGDEYTVRVTTVTGLTRTSTIKVVSPAKKLVISDKKLTDENTTPSEYENKSGKKNQMEIAIGESKSLYPCVNISTTSAESWKNAGAAGDGYLADSVVSWTVNKQGIVNISLEDGKAVVKGMKDGKVTITAKTATGKSAKLTVTVNVPTASEN